jgi:hypothetical protein
MTGLQSQSNGWGLTWANELQQFFLLGDLPSNSKLAS